MLLEVPYTILWHRNYLMLHCGDSSAFETVKIERVAGFGALDGFPVRPQLTRDLPGILLVGHASLARRGSKSSELSSAS